MIDPRASELQEAFSDDRADDADYWQEALWEELAAEQESLPGPDPQPEPPVLRCPDCLRSFSACTCPQNPFAD